MENIINFHLGPKSCNDPPEPKKPCFRRDGEALLVVENLSEKQLAAFRKSFFEWFDDRVIAMTEIEPGIVHVTPKHGFVEQFYKDCEGYTCGYVSALNAA